MNALTRDLEGLTKSAEAKADGKDYLSEAASDAADRMAQ